MTYRPGRVVALSIILIIFAFLGVIGAVAVELIASSMVQSAITNYVLGIINFYTLSYYYPIPPEEMQYYMSTLLSYAMLNFANTSFLVGYLHIITLVLLVGVVLYVAAAIGLLMMKNWGRYLGLLVATFNIIAGVFLLIVVVGLLYIVFGIVMLAYLMGDVKYEFTE